MSEKQTVIAKIKIEVSSASAEKLVLRVKSLIKANKRLLRRCTSKLRGSEFTSELELSANTASRLAADLMKLGRELDALGSGAMLLMINTGASSEMCVFGEGDISEYQPSPDSVFESNMRLEIRISAPAPADKDAFAFEKPDKKSCERLLSLLLESDAVVLLELGEFDSARGRVSGSILELSIILSEVSCEYSRLLELEELFAYIRSKPEDGKAALCLRLSAARTDGEGFFYSPFQCYDDCACLTLRTGENLLEVRQPFRAFI